MPRPVHCARNDSRARGRRLLLVLVLGLSALIGHVSRAADGAPTSPNLIANSSFEAGIDYRFAMGRWYIHGLPSVLLDSGTSVHGAYSARLPITRTALTRKPVERDGITFRAAVPVMVQAGVEYSFSAYFRSDATRRGKISITRNSAYEHRDGVLASKEITIGRGWKRSGLKFKATSPGEVYWEINVASSDPGAVWVDALQLEQGGYTEYRPKLEIEAGLTSDSLGRIFTPPESVKITLRAFNNRAAAVGHQRFRLRVVDFAGADVYTDDNVDIAVPPGAGHEKVMVLPIRRFGAYRGILSDVDTGMTHGELSFSVLPPARPVSAEESAFGAYLTLAPEPLEIAHRLGFRWIGSLTSNGRVSSWISVEPHPGNYFWYDEDVADARRRGFGLMFNLEPCSMPKWAARLEPAQRRERWARYVSAMAQHYRGLVQYWTISDEADHKKKCWSDAVEYAKWHKMGHDAIKAVDRQAGVVINSSPEFSERVLGVLPSGDIDVLAGNYYHIPAAIRDMREVARRHDIRQVWAPGIGEWTLSFYPQLAGGLQRQPASENYWPEVLKRQIRSTVQTFAHGAQRLFHYTATYVGNTNNYSLFDSDSGLKPTGAQFGALIWLLDGFSDAVEIEVDGIEKPLRVYRLNRRDGKAIYAFWGVSGSNQALSLPEFDAGQDAILYDHFANEMAFVRHARGISFELGRYPVFLQLPAHLAPLADKAFRSAVVRLQALPQAGAQETAGRYAKLTNLNDGEARNTPNISLWYDSRARGWTELFRYRSSHYPANYSVDESGITVEWDFVRRSDAFHVGIGQFPADLVQGAKHMVHANREGRQERREGDACGGKLHKPASRSGWTRDVNIKQPHGLAFLLRNGLIAVVETELMEPAGTTQAQLPGAWSIVTQGPACFLHVYYPAGRNERIRIRSRIRVMEAASVPDTSTKPLNQRIQLPYGPIKK